MFNWFMAAMLAIGCAGSLLVWVMKARRYAAAWMTGTIFFGIYTVIMFVSPIVAVAEHWTIFDQVAGMFVAGSASGCACSYAWLRYDHEKKYHD